MPKVGGVEDDYSAHLCQRALYVEDTDSNEGREPTNGHEYIRDVRKETEELFPNHKAILFPAIYSREADENSANSVINANSVKEWLNREAHYFTELALKLKSSKRTLKLKFPLLYKYVIPQVEDEKEIFTFLLGSSLYKNIFKEDVTEESVGNPPLLSVVLHLDQDEIIILLKYLFGWGKQIAYPHEICVWIYSLLAVLEKPLCDDWNNFLEDIYDYFVSISKKFSKNKRHQLRLLSAILKNYFCVKAYALGPSLDRFLLED